MGPTSEKPYLNVSIQAVRGYLAGETIGIIFIFSKTLPISAFSMPSAFNLYQSFA